MAVSGRYFYGMQIGGLGTFFRIAAMCVCRNLQLTYSAELIFLFK